MFLILFPGGCSVSTLAPIQVISHGRHLDSPLGGQPGNVVPGCSALTVFNEPLSELTCSHLSNARVGPFSHSETSIPSCSTSLSHVCDVLSSDNPPGNIVDPVALFSPSSISKTLDSSKGNKLTILFWNIAGLANKISDVNWLSLVSNYTIVCLQETWAITTPFIDGFQTFVQQAVPSVAGRAKGGLSLFVNNLSNLDLARPLLSSNFYQLGLFRVGNNMHLLCINFYNNIAANDRVEVMQKFNHDLEFIQNWRGLDPVIIWGGDFNCHLCTITHAGPCGVVDIFGNPARHFVHSAWGTLLNSTLIKFGFSFSNDLSFPQSQFVPTYHSRGQASTIDYILVSHHFRDKSFQSTCFSSIFSDHFPLSLNLAWNAGHCTNQIVHLPFPGLSAHRLNGPRLRWDRIQPPLFFEQLVKDNRDAIETCLNSVADPDDIVNAL